MEVGGDTFMNTQLSQIAGWLAMVALAIGILLAGCGQKGDLYLPEDEQTALIDPPIR